MIVGFKNIVKKALSLCALVFCTFLMTNAQNEYQTDSFTVREMVFKHPFNEVIDYLNNPDTLLICHYPLRYYKSDGAPVSVTIYVYKENGNWKSASLLEFAKTQNKSKDSWKQKQKTYWKLTEPMWLQSDFRIAEKMKELRPELRSNIAKEDISTIHTYGFVKYGDDITTFWITGNLRDDLFTRYPNLSYILTVSFFESYNLNIVKKYRQKETEYVPNGNCRF